MDQVKTENKKDLTQSKKKDQRIKLIKDRSESKSGQITKYLTLRVPYAKDLWVRCYSPNSHLSLNYGYFRGIILPAIFFGSGPGPIEFLMEPQSGRR